MRDGTAPAGANSAATTGSAVRPGQARPLERRIGDGTLRRSRSRWAVHLGLLCSAAAALGTLQLLHVRIAIHADVGLVFVGLVVVHLVQRRRTVARLALQLIRRASSPAKSGRLAVSDIVLLVVALNVLVSGLVDWGRGAPSAVPLPQPFHRWHLDAGLVLVVYLVVHVWHRRKRLRHSVIR